MIMANAYWVVWTMFLPMVVTMFMGRCLATKGKIGKGWYFVLFVSILVRFLCGFEFVSSVMLATEVPFVYYFFHSPNMEMRKKWLKVAVWVGILEVLAFAVAFGITVFQNMAWQNQGFLAALNNITDAIKYRTGFMETQENIQNYSEAVANSLTVSRWSVVRKYLTSSDALWYTWSTRELSFFWLLSATGKAFFGGRRCIQECVCQGILLIVSLLPAVSWYYLGSAHSAIHTPVNYLLLLLPFVPICVGLLFKNTVEVVQILTKEKLQK